MEVPSQIGKYKIVKELGRGATGFVLQAEQEIIHRMVAIKLLFNNLVKVKPKIVHRFRREARLASSLVHPNIVPIFEVGEEKGMYYYVMQYVEGKPLVDYIPGDGSLEQRLDIFIQFCDALALAHSKGIIHRDLKPHNVLVSQNFSPLILDFGIAKRLMDDGEGLTQTGNILGSAHYMAPEQAASKEVGTYTDVFAIGVMMYEIFTKERPFKGNSVRDLILERIEYGKHYEQYRPEPMRTVNSEIPEALDEIMFKCIHSDPSQRYNDADKVLADLQKFRQQLRIHQMVSHREPKKKDSLVVRPINKKTSYLYPFLIFLLLMFVGVSLSAWLFWGQGKYPAIDQYLQFMKPLENVTLDSVMERIKSQ